MVCHPIICMKNTNKKISVEKNKELSIFDEITLKNEIIKTSRISTAKTIAIPTIVTSNGSIRPPNQPFATRF